MTSASQFLTRRVRVLRGLSIGLLLAGLGLSLLFWHLTARRDAAEADEQFHNASRHAARLVEERILRAMDLVFSFHGLFSVSDDVTRREFHDHAEALKIPLRFPGVIAVQYLRLVSAAQREAFEAMVRADASIDPSGYPDYAIHPAGERPFYMPVLYNEPMAGNEATFGFDTDADPMRQRVTERARDTGEASLSPPILLSQGGGGFMIRQPVYLRGSRLDTVAARRAAFRGLITGVFDAQLVVGGLLREYRRDSRIRIEDRGREDADEPAASMLLYDSHAAAAASLAAFPVAPRDRREIFFPLAGRLWALTMERPAVRYHTAPWPLAVLLGGCVTTFAGFWLAYGFASHYATASRRSERLVHEAHHDALTGLPNRLLFHRHLEQALQEARRDGGRLALLFIDLDRFKPINDRFGHEAGDTVLVAVGDRLRDVLRPGDTVARLGGDEFLVLLPGLSVSRIWHDVAERILEQIRQPIPYGSERLVIDASLGVALYPEDGAEAGDLLRLADAAMYRGKQSRAALPDAGPQVVRSEIGVTGR